MDLRKPKGRIMNGIWWMRNGRNGSSETKWKNCDGICWMRKRTEWSSETRWWNCERNMMDEKWTEWVFGNQLVELRTVYDGWETDRTSSPEGNHRDLQDLMGPDDCDCYFFAHKFCLRIWRDWCCEVGEVELFLRVSGIGYWAGIAMDL